MKTDVLTCDLTTLALCYQYEWNRDCTCHCPAVARHTNRCGITPIYAELFKKHRLPPNLWAWTFNNYLGSPIWPR